MTDKTLAIYSLTAPYNNPYQGNDVRVVFCCSVGMLRSATASKLATRFNARCCGTSSLALIPLSVNLITWADKIVFMNPKNLDEAKRTFRNRKEVLARLDIRGVVWDIPDTYEYMDPKLVDILNAKIAEL